MDPGSNPREAVFFLSGLIVINEWGSGFLHICIYVHMHTPNFLSRFRAFGSSERLKQGNVCGLASIHGGEFKIPRWQSTINENPTKPKESQRSNCFPWKDIMGKYTGKLPSN